MKIYQASWTDSDMGHILRWHGNKREALRDVARAKREGADDPSGVRELDIPNTKKGLIDWLNVRFTSDNG